MNYVKVLCKLFCILFFAFYGFCYGQFTAPSPVENQVGIINVRQYLNLNTDVTSALQNIINSNAATYNYKLVFLPGTYKISGSGLTFPAPTSANFSAASAASASAGIFSWEVEFRPGARLVYTGSGAAAKFQTTKRIRVDNMHIDMSSNASFTAIGVQIDGVWGAQFKNTVVALGQTGHTGIAINSSAPANLTFGAYEINFSATRISGAAGIGVRSRKTPGDTVGVTHLRFIDGYINGTTNAFDLSDSYNVVIDNIALDTVYGDAYRFTNCTDVLVLPGELPPAANLAQNGNHFNLVANNASISIVTTQLAGNLKTSPAYTKGIHILARDRVSVYGSRADTPYSASFISRYDYLEPFAIKAQGGSTNSLRILGWNEQISNSQTNAVNVPYQ